MKRILVGHDGSAAADVAYRWASRVAVAVDADLVVANVVDTGAYGQAMRSDDIGEAMTALKSWCGRLPANEHAQRESLEVVDGVAGRALRDLADANAADLVVVGAHRPVGISPWMGTTATDIVHRGTTPVAVIPAHETAHTGRFVVGIDGSDQSLRALRFASEMAQALGGSVLAVRAFAPPAEWVARTSAHRFVHDAQDELDGWVESLGTTVPLTTHLVTEHHPVTVLCDEAERIDAELIAVGSRGVGGFPGMRVGGTAMGLFHHAPYPLLLVPPEGLDQ